MYLPFLKKFHLYHVRYKCHLTLYDLGELISSVEISFKKKVKLISLDNKYLNIKLI